MLKNKIDLKSIIYKASGLIERLRVSTSVFPLIKDDPKVNERFQQWREIVTKGDDRKFKQYLEWRNLDINKILPLLNDNHIFPDEYYPKWALTLDRIINKAQETYDKGDLFNFSLQSNDLPFIDFYSPLVDVAMELLVNLVGEKISLLEKTAELELKRNLIKRLHKLCFPVLMYEFDKLRMTNDSQANWLYFYLNGLKSGKSKYNCFIQKIFEDGLYSLFSEYSVLGKLIGTTINYWVEAKSEFIHYLYQDWSDIKNLFSPDTQINKVIQITGDLSDSHNQGRSVILLTFDTGMKLIYKPRSLSLDTALYKLQNWCNKYSELLDLKTLKVLNRVNYGWVEYVEKLPCETEESVRLFYTRAGMLLCFIYILNGSDFHYENLIAHADQPILIDLEGLMVQDVVMTDQVQPKSALDIVCKHLDESVLKASLLPTRGTSKFDQLNVDIGGLAAVEGGIYKDIITYLNINTDAMYENYEIFEPEKNNIPKLAENAHVVKGYMVEVVKGFEQMYRFLLDHKTILLAPDSPLMDIIGHKSRYVCRPTKVYATVLNDSYSLNCLKSGVDRSIFLEILGRAFAILDEKPLAISMLEDELNSMDNDLDIPYFYTDSSTNHLFSSRGIVTENLFDKSTTDYLMSRIRNLGEENLAQQIDIIEKSFYARFNKDLEKLGQEIKIENIQTLSNDKSAITSQLLEQAITIGQDLQQRAIYTNHENIVWIGLEYIPQFQDFRINTLLPNLYDGVTGVGLLFAALFKVTQDVQWQELAVKALQPYGQNLLQAFNNDNNQLFLGKKLAWFTHGLTGVTSHIYGLIKISQLLEKPAFIEIARKIAAWITIDAIDADERFNILEGSAGTLLSLLALYEIEGDEHLAGSELLEKAIACGEHLLKHQTSIDGLPKAWKNREDQQLTGFCEGAAGIAYALLRLFAITKDERFLAGASEAISYEQSQFADEFHNWPDLRKEEPCCRVNFSQGAAGIALGRLGGISVLNNEQVRQDIEIALTTTQKYILGHVDNLCWGNFGRLETLLVAATKLNRPDLLELAQGIASHLAREANSRGRFIFSSSIKADDPGFFHGSSGIGYELLRIAYPQLLPSILLWE